MHMLVFVRGNYHEKKRPSSKRRSPLEIVEVEGTAVAAAAAAFADRPRFLPERFGTVDGFLGLGGGDGAWGCGTSEGGQRGGRWRNGGSGGRGVLVYRKKRSINVKLHAIKGSRS